MTTTKTSRAPKLAPVARFHVNKTDIVERTYTGIDWNAAVSLSDSSGKFESSIVTGFFIGKAAPTFDDFKVYVKSLEGKHTTPTKRSHNALYITLAHAGKIQTAIDSGFKSLDAWENYVIERTRKTEPNISALGKLARAFMNGEKIVDAQADFNKALIAAYKKAGNLPNSKTAQNTLDALAAIAAMHKLELPKPE